MSDVTTTESIVTVVPKLEFLKPGQPRAEVRPGAPLQWLDMSSWDHVPIPERKWSIRDRVPLKQAGLFSGEGGTGKSIIELMKNEDSAFVDNDQVEEAGRDPHDPRTLAPLARSLR
jgi:hypothetical protein